MAKVWRVYEGKEPTLGGPWVAMPLEDAVHVLELEPKHFLSALSHPPKFEDGGRGFSWAGYRHVVVEVGKNEATTDWRPGFYRSPLSYFSAVNRLLVWSSIKDLLGCYWRVELKEGRDADGDPALWVWIALRADAPDSEWTVEKRERIRERVMEVIAENEFEDWVFVRFRKDAEERVAS